jgi:hypothetical protein
MKWFSTIALQPKSIYPTIGASADFEQCPTAHCSKQVTHEKRWRKPLLVNWVRGNL